MTNRIHQAISSGLSILLLTTVALGVAACAKNNRAASGVSTSTVLRISMIPSTDPGKILRESQPLVSYLEQETGAKVELTVPTNYAAVVEAIANDQVDIAYFGGFTYVQASQRAGVTALVQRERDRKFHSVFITYPGSGINSLADLKGRTFAFGDVNSTSGHLMPEYFMRQQNVDPEVIAKAVYTGGHDATALAVVNKKVDAGAMDEAIFAKMMKDGKLEAGKVRVFYTTPPFFDYIWASRRALDPQLAEKFSVALLKLSDHDESKKKILELLNATRYERANDSDYNNLRQAARDAGLMK
jgi:phosphonate transport system substrate-binding protein